MKVTAKPITWNQEGEDHWFETDYGFSINFDDLSPAKFTAHWGEGDEESFDTLQEAKIWCQETIDDWVSKIAVVEITVSDT